MTRRKEFPAWLSRDYELHLQVELIFLTPKLSHGTLESSIRSSLFAVWSSNLDLSLLFDIFQLLFSIRTCSLDLSILLSQLIQLSFPQLLRVNRHVNFGNQSSLFLLICVLANFVLFLRILLLHQALLRLWLLAHYFWLLNVL